VLVSVSRLELLLDGIDNDSECRFLDYKYSIIQHLQPDQYTTIWEQRSQQIQYITLHVNLSSNTSWK